MLVKVLFYASAVGVPASRQIARKLEEDVAFRVLTANQQPDVRTISDVRKQHRSALTDLFVQVLKLCQWAGLVKLGHIALDGTKVKANASKHKAMSYGRMVTEEARLKAEIEALLKQAEAADARDDAAYGYDRRGDELPAEVARREQRRQTIRAAKAVLEQEAQAAAAVQQAAREARETEGPRWGRPPQPPSPVPLPQAQRNFTDPESRIMPAPGAKGSVIQGYNCQAAVDATAQIIVAAEVTEESNDKPQAQPWLTQVLVNTEQVPRTVSMDAGHFSEANVEAMAALGCELPDSAGSPTARTRPARRPSRPTAGRIVGGGADAAHLADPAGPTPVCQVQSDRRASVRTDQAGPQVPPVPVARPAEGSRGMGADLHDAQCAQALDRAPSAAPTPTAWTAGADWQPEGRAESPGVAGCRRADHSAEERILNQLSRTRCSHFNIGRAPSDRISNDPFILRLQTSCCLCLL